MERTFGIGEPAPAAWSLQTKGMADEPLCRGPGGDALLERGDAQAEFHTRSEPNPRP